MLTHRDARTLISEGFRRVYGTEPTRSQAQCVQAIGWLETNYGAGWSKSVPGAAESNNWGAVTAGKEWEGATFEHRDSYPDSNGSNHWYVTKFRSYPSPADGAHDLVRIVYLKREGVLKAATAGDVLGVSQTLYATGYYKGFGKTPEERIANHHKAVMNAIALQCKALGEDPPSIMSAADIEAMALEAHHAESRIQNLETLANAAFDAISEIRNEASREMTDHDTDPLPPPEESNT